jgi:hypothetical protein
MTPEDLRRNEAVRWLAVAVKGMNAARILAPLEPAASLFHSQQAAEKALKGFLAFHNVPFRKIHDIKELGEQCIGIDATLSPFVQEAADPDHVRRDLPVPRRAKGSGPGRGSASFGNCTAGSRPDMCTARAGAGTLILP